jgi:hypothetical protein
MKNHYSILKNELLQGLSTAILVQANFSTEDVADLLLVSTQGKQVIGRRGDSKRKNGAGTKAKAAS